jgi:biopolymer transport protein ExbD
MRLKRRHFRMTLPAGEMNVVSFMDVLTTLLFFLLLSASFTKYAAVPASGTPTQLAPKQADPKPQFALELVLHSPTEATVWLGPLAGLRIVDEAKLRAHLATVGFKGTESTGWLRKVSVGSPKDMETALHETIVPIKKSFPTEQSAVIAMADGVKYEEMVDVIQSVRTLDKKDKGLETVDPMGNPVRSRILFPTIIISEWQQGAGDREPAGAGD